MDQTTIITSFVILPIAGYLLGSIPFGLLLGLTRSVDIRHAGSGNIGSTNVARLLGRKWGYLCFILDVAKGFLPVCWAGSYLHRLAGGASHATLPTALQWAWLSVAAACVLGHMFSIYLRFYGGKGVATSLGVLLGLWPYFTLAAILAFAVWTAVWGAWRYVSLASIVAAVSFPAAFVVLIWRLDQWYFVDLWPLFIFSCLMGLIVVLRHRTNIARLFAGTENRSH